MPGHRVFKRRRRNRIHIWVTIHGIRINVEVLNIVVCFLLFLLKSELDSLPKIDQFYVVFTIDHDVLGLQVSMRDSMLLEMG